MDSSQTIREQLRKRRRRKFWHMVRLLVSTAILAVTCTYVWRYVHNLRLPLATSAFTEAVS